MANATEALGAETVSIAQQMRCAGAQCKFTRKMFNQFKLIDQKLCETKEKKYSHYVIHEGEHNFYKYIMISQGATLNRFLPSSNCQMYLNHKEV